MSNIANAHLAKNNAKQEKKKKKQEPSQKKPKSNKKKNNKRKTGGLVPPHNRGSVKNTGKGTLTEGKKNKHNS